MQRSHKLMLKQMASRLHMFYLQWQKVLLLRSWSSLKMRYKVHMRVLRNMWKIFRKRLKRRPDGSLTCMRECSLVGFLSWVFSCKFAIHFQKTFSSEHLWRSVSVTFKKRLFHVAFTFLKTQSGKMLKWVRKFLYKYKEMKHPRRSIHIVGI